MFQVSSYNFPHLWGLLCLSCNAIIGVFQNIPGIQSVFLIPSYIEVYCCILPVFDNLLLKKCLSGMWTCNGAETNIWCHKFFAGRTYIDKCCLACWNVAFLIVLRTAIFSSFICRSASVAEHASAWNGRAQQKHTKVLLLIFSVSLSCRLSVTTIVIFAFAFMQYLF